MKIVGLKMVLHFVFVLCCLLSFVDDAIAGEEKFLLAFLPGPFSNASQAYAAKMFERHGDEFGFDVKVFATGDSELQAENVRKFVADGAAAIVINPNDIVAIVPALKKAKEAGVVVALFSSDLPDKLANARDIFCGVDDTVAGEVAAKAFIDKFPDGAKIVEIGGQNGHDAQLKRYQGFHKLIDNSNIEVLASQNCNGWSTEDAKKIMEEFIMAFGNEIEGVFCHWDNGATGIIQALEAEDIDDVYIVAVDGCCNGFKQILAGKQSVTIAQNIENIAIATMDLVKKKLHDEDVTEVNFIPFETVTSENINEHETPQW